MSNVLERFIAQATEDDYARAEVPTPKGRPRRGFADKALGVTIWAVIVIVLAAGVATVRSTVDLRAGTQEALADRVTQLQEAVVIDQERVAALSASVAQLSDEVEDGSAVQVVQSLVGEMASAAGTEALSGAGLTVVVDDAPDAEAGSLNRVLDRDIQDIVNALWQMGADGVSVNGQRVIQTTAIRGAGEAILVNYRPLERPYEISAVGVTDAEGSRLQQILGQLGADYGLVSRIAAGDTSLPGGQIHLPVFAEATDDQKETP